MTHQRACLYRQPPPPILSLPLFSTTSDSPLLQPLFDAMGHHAGTAALLIGTSLFLLAYVARLNSSAADNHRTSVVDARRPPLVVNTWPFINATRHAFAALESGRSALDAVEVGCHVCEVEQCDGSVGYGNHPDELAQVTLDAMIMDGRTIEVGSVGALHDVKAAVSVARQVMERTRHTLLVGRDATRFAVELGFRRENLSDAQSQREWQQWRARRCQPNFWRDVLPDPTSNCGPYHLPTSSVRSGSGGSFGFADESNHDTIGMLALSDRGQLACATSTNGASHKVAGRVGDSPIAGAGAYCDDTVGGAVATGDGDIMMRFLPTFLAVERMRSGDTPLEAARYAIALITRRFGARYEGALVAADMSGRVGAACHGFGNFRYSIRSSEDADVVVVAVACD